MKKVKRSIQAVAITTIFGFFVSKTINITNLIIIDKMIFKIISTIAFVVGTACVGYLFKLRLITNRTDGEKARIFLYITIYLTLIGVLFGIVSFLEDSGVYILAGLFVVASIWLFIAMFKNKKVTKSNKIQRQRCKIVIQQKENESKKEHVATHVVQKQPEEQLKTLYQLWNEKDVTAKSIAVTNTINPDLKWIRIYKGPYGNGKFYGYIMMNNARHTVDGEIYFATQKCWKLLA